MKQALKIPLLYIDDEQVNLLAFRANFRRDYEVYTATSGEAGKKLIEDHNIKIVVADQRMPKMTGVEFFEWIQKDHPDTIRILLTGFTDISAVIDSINKGKIYSYITKPWDEAQLRQTFEGGIEQSYRNAYNRNIEERYNHLFEQSSDAVITVDQNSNIIKANQAAIILFDYKLEEIVTMKLEDLIKDINAPAELLKVSGKMDQVIYNKFQKSLTCKVSVAPINANGDSEEVIHVILKKS
ncbi:MAG: PAS domain S-box-containing protein [Crocinitomicaceae bacterium]|jgi:PAS domain S-box-containing protein